MVHEDGERDPLELTLVVEPLEPVPRPVQPAPPRRVSVDPVVAAPAVAATVFAALTWWGTGG